MNQDRTAIIVVPLKSLYPAEVVLNYRQTPLDEVYDERLTMFIAGSHTANRATTATNTWNRPHKAQTRRVENAENGSTKLRQEI